MEILFFLMQTLHFFIFLSIFLPAVIIAKKGVLQEIFPAKPLFHFLFSF